MMDEAKRRMYVDQEGRLRREIAFLTDSQPRLLDRLRAAAAEYAYNTERLRGCQGDLGYLLVLAAEEGIELSIPSTVASPEP